MLDILNEADGAKHMVVNSDLLKETGRFDLSGNRMTVYAPTLGGGSISFINGLWTNNENCVPIEMTGVFSGHDGDLEVLCPESGLHFCQPYETIWYPHGIRARYAGPQYCHIMEQKTIYEDTFVSKISITNSINRSLELRLRLAYNLSESELIGKGRDFIHAFSDSGPLKGIHRIIGFPGIVLNHGKRYIEILCEPAVTGTESPRNIFFVVAMDDEFDTALEKFNQISQLQDTVFDLVEKQWQAFFDDQIPQTDVDFPSWLKVVYHSFYVLKANQIDYVDGAWKHPFSCPSKFRLRIQWFWDSAFQAIGESWIKGADIAKSSLRNITDNQADDGHMIFMLDKKGDFNWRTGLVKEKLVQPFILPVAVWQILNITGDLEFAKSMLEPMIKFDRYLEENRADAETGLIHIKAGCETGLDNSIRFHQRLLNGAANADLCIAPIGDNEVQPIDFNTYIFIGRCIIARLLRLFERDEEAIEYSTKAGKIRSGILKCFNEHTGMFNDRIGLTAEHTSIMSAAGFMPMLLGQLPEKNIGALVDHLTNENEFWTRYAIPMLSINEKRFSSDNVYYSYANGRTFMPINWLICQGLVANGQYLVAAELIEKCFDMVNCTGKLFLGEGYHPTQPFVYDIYHNIFNYGWNGLLIDLFYRNVAGIVPRAYKDEITLNPLPVKTIRTAKVSDLPVGLHTLDIVMERKGEKFFYQIKHKGSRPITISYNNEQAVADNETINLSFSPIWKPFSWIPVIARKEEKVMS